MPLVNSISLTLPSNRGASPIFEIAPRTVNIGHCEATSNMVYCFCYEHYSILLSLCIVCLLNAISTIVVSFFFFLNCICILMSFGIVVMPVIRTDYPHVFHSAMWPLLLTYPIISHYISILWLCPNNKYLQISKITQIIPTFIRYDGFYPIL